MFFKSVEQERKLRDIVYKILPLINQLTFEEVEEVTRRAIVEIKNHVKLELDYHLSHRES